MEDSETSLTALSQDHASLLDAVKCCMAMIKESVAKSKASLSKDSKDEHSQFNIALDDAVRALNDVKFEDLRENDKIMKQGKSLLANHQKKGNDVNMMLEKRDKPDGYEKTRATKKCKFPLGTGAKNRSSCCASVQAGHWWKDSVCKFYEQNRRIFDKNESNSDKDKSIEKSIYKRNPSNNIQSNIQSSQPEPFLRKRMEQAPA